MKKIVSLYSILNSRLHLAEAPSLNQLDLGLENQTKQVPESTLTLHEYSVQCTRNRNE